MQKILNCPFNTVPPPPCSVSQSEWRILSAAEDLCGGLQPQLPAADDGDRWRLLVIWIIFVPQRRRHTELQPEVSSVRAGSEALHHGHCLGFNESVRFLREGPHAPGKHQLHPQRVFSLPTSFELSGSGFIRSSLSSCLN